MSYNIDSTKLKKLNNFVIPLKAFYNENIPKDWMPDKPKMNVETNTVSISMGCGQSIEGILKDGNINVSKIDIAGEGSGTLKHYVLNEIFKQSTGEYEAILIWEGGDSISKLSVIDGEITEKDVEF